MAAKLALMVRRMIHFAMAFRTALEGRRISGRRRRYFNQPCERHPPSDATDDEHKEAQRLAVVRYAVVP
ncbi:hypothetical protein U1839_00740 [Sphingomonas sp. RT2P30]|uniref:hypothetical protein n=1 Tax=Parasphingomonas halimpatiens TaxID=3096162 RepID=UPI002FCC1A05